ncbi:MAG: tryptophan transporter [Tissierellia bacterium]|nr:tryptophan transporter [Tissierellia bacterium]
MKTKEITFSAIMLAIGTMLHLVFPGMILGITPDFILPSLFIAMSIKPTFKKSLALGLTAGCLAALITTAPGGQISNIIDKLITSMVIFFIMKNVYRYKMDNVKMGSIVFVGTLISGMVFLYTMKLLYGLDASIITILAVTVVPAAIMNTFIGLIMYNAYSLSIKSSMA